jgi:hypothetical protein
VRPAVRTTVRIPLSNLAAKKESAAGQVYANSLAVLVDGK